MKSYAIQNNQVNSSGSISSSSMLNHRLHLAFSRVLRLLNNRNYYVRSKMTENQYSQNTESVGKND